MTHTSRILLSVGVCAFALMCPNVAATVISVDGNGQYNVDEVKDFRQRGETNPASKVSTQTAPAINPADTRAPVTARIVTPQSETASAFSSIETETALPPKADLEAAPEANLKSTVLPAELSVALPVEVEMFEPVSAEIFDPTVAGVVPGNDAPAQTQAAAKLPISGPFDVAAIDTATMLNSFVMDYTDSAIESSIAKDSMTPEDLHIAAARARSDADNVLKPNLAASMIPDAYKSSIDIEGANTPVTARPVGTTPQAASLAPAPTLSSRTDTKPYAAIVASIAENYPELDTALIHAVIEVESNYNPQALSKKSAMGLMQLMPKTAKGHKVVDAFDPTENIRGGAAELSLLMKKYDNVGLALAAYNAGQKAVDKYDGIPPYKETREYVVKVLSKTFDNRKRATKLPQVGDTQSTKAAEIETKEKPRKMSVYTFDW